MNQEQIVWLVLLLSCLVIFSVAPILYAIQAIRRSKHGEKAEIPQSYRFMADSVALGQNAFKKLRDPFGEENADLAELAELTNKIREEDQEAD